MIISTIKGVKMQAIAACVPEKTINNREFALKNFPNDDLSSTISALGVEQRHIVEKDDTTALTLCIEAGKKVLEGVDVNEIGAVVFVTLTPDCLMPNNASYAQHLLGLPNGIAAFDINHACSGYLFGLWNVAMIVQNIGKKVLLLDGDVNSKYVSQWDKSTALLFGDAGTATLLTPDIAAPDWNFTFNTDGSNRDVILMRLGMKYPIKPEYLSYNEYPDGSKRRFIDMQMDGRKVFDYVLDVVPPIVNNFMDELETGAVEYDKLLLHQANAFMLKRLAKSIGFSKDKMPLSMNKYGNTSSVSIPLTICSELTEESVGKVLMIGMGAGLATGVGEVSLSGVENKGMIVTPM